jgi:fumarate reductase subunit D
MKPFLWLLFGAGGMLTALLAPVLVLLFGIAVPLGWVEPPGRGQLLALLHSELIRCALLCLCVLALFHWAYRFYFVLRDTLRLRRGDRILLTACYAGAVAGSVAAGFVILGI